MSLLYILVDGEPVSVADPIVWAEWFQKSDRVIKNSKVGKYDVNTVFNGIDDGITLPPYLFETVIFGEGWKRLFDDRYQTVKQAQDGHKLAVKLAESWVFGSNG